ncbi:hypothetical protein EDD34_2111 [Myceligenerans xiligouense]|uniref:Uncharacterized protein n=1 Tax=Myceligenerans xiligouense TaxID=253184 RepID=A0A3N4Z836_9MICO|nr:hypothetical protein EDD34_2111 [Myceligenerans xiligouense]
MLPVEHLVDLDVLADRLLPVIEEWKRTAFVGPLTWRDEGSGWPKPNTSDRSHVIVPESLGLRLRKHALDDEFEMVVWVGGWADVDYLLDGEIYAFCPEFRDVDGAHRAVINEVTDFLA